ncbi:MFS transporter [Halomonas sp. NPDC076908]|uniref:MFS transporter n=1 Tax=Halomonas sp. NPDC076908 TaxID=3390567 RepID=UPI003D094952|nr:MFS transporter [Gammaproteobacteria bacterium]
MNDKRLSASRSTRALSLLNFSLADVRDGLGPFLGIYLVALGWAPAEIGFVMTVAGFASLLATTPAGMLADATHFKRLLVICCALLVATVNLVLLFWPQTWFIAFSQIVTGIAAAAIGPAILSLTLGLVGQIGLAHQLGQNQAYNHGGNATAAILAALIGYFYGVEAVFYLMAFMAALTIFLVLKINPADIDYEEARGLDKTTHQSVSIKQVFQDHPMLLIVGLTLLLFHLGNAAMLPLLGQRVATNELMNPAVYTAGTVVIAQATMIPMALLAAWYSHKNGYWLLFLVALLVLPIRGVMAATIPGLWSVVPVQILDGIGAGLLGVATPGIVAQILRGTGRVNMGLGAVMTIQGVGAALSASFAGIVASWFSYEAAFLALAGVAGIAVVVWLLCFDRGVSSSPLKVSV